MSLPRVWFITGASTGFGRILTELILSKGEIAIATARRPSALDDLKAKHPSNRLLVVKLDVSQPQEIIAAFAEAKKAFGRIDVVVNNAAWATFGEVEGAQDADVRAMFETNFWGAANVSREAVRFFRDVNAPGAGGRLLQISSVTGVVGVPAGGYYSATKFALEGLTEALASELDPAWNIKITIIEPGSFHTEGPGKIFWAPEHPAYANPKLPATQMRKGWDVFSPPGDAKKGVEAFYEIAALPEVPLHLPLGKDSVAATKQKASSLLAAAEKYEYFSENLELSK
ncbi:NAD-P-binding protein [Trametes meyenii]|nr:NAD-P-binding protein [Trametes meyenii]